MQLGQNESIREILEETDTLDSGVDLPSSVGLRESFPPVDDQGSLGSSAVHAVIGLLGRRVPGVGRRVDLSSRFLYKTARKLVGRGRHRSESPERAGCPGPVWGTTGAILTR